MGSLTLVWLSAEKQAALVSKEESDLLSGKLFDTFNNHRISHQILKEEFDERGLPNAITSTDEVLAYRQGEYVRFLPHWSRALAYYGALRMITGRLCSDEAQLKASLALGDDTQHELLVRVQKRPKESLSKRAALDTFIEGYDSVAFAGTHLELGGAKLEDPARFARAVLGYTAIVPGTALVAPMALRGEYFRNFAAADGEIRPEYRSVFKDWQRERALRGRRKPYVNDLDLDELNAGPPYDPDYCNAVGLPIPAKVEFVPEYETEGCAGLYRRIVYNAAHLFMQKVEELSQPGRKPPHLAYLELAPIIAAGKAESDRMR